MTKEIEQAIVRIKDNKNNVFGAGFLVCCNEILTCQHVVADCLEIPRETQEMPNIPVFLDFPLLEMKSPTISAIVKYWDPQADIALLELLVDVPEKAIPIDLGKVNDYSLGKFGVCGFPNDIGDWVYGKMLGKTELGYIQVEGITAHRIQGGFSGGPVWHHDENKLAGMVVASDEKIPTDKIAYIIPVSVLLNALPHLKKKIISPVSLQYACFISFPNDGPNSLSEIAARDLKEDLETEISANLKNKRVLAKSTRTAKELCESACLIMLYTGRYFDSEDPLCTQEYHAMSLLEQVRISELKKDPTDGRGFIIPIVLRGEEMFPENMFSSRTLYNFVNYFMINRSERRRRKEYRQAIYKIAQFIVAQFNYLDKNLPNPCADCSDYELPKEKDVQELIKDLSPNWVL